MVQSEQEQSLVSHAKAIPGTIGDTAPTEQDAGMQYLQTPRKFLWVASEHEQIGPVETDAWRQEHIEEAWRLLQMAGPLVLAVMVNGLVFTISTVFLGHLSSRALAVSSLATSLESATGTAVLQGLSYAVETLGGHAVGAQRPHDLGLTTQRAILVSLTLSICVACFWWNSEAFLVLTGQSAELARPASRYLRLLIPGLFSQGVSFPLQKYLQSLERTAPLMCASMVTLVLHIFNSWLFIYALDFKLDGAAIASIISSWSQMLMLAAYIAFWTSHEEHWPPLNVWRLWAGTWPFLRSSIPCVVLSCAEVWVWEVLVIVSGTLPHPEASVSTFTVFYATVAFFFQPCFGFSAAICTRVSTELGAQSPRGMARAARTGLVLGLFLSTLVPLTLAALHRSWPFVFFSTDVDPAFLRTASKLVLLAALLQPVDFMQFFMAGVLRGCQRPTLCAVTSFSCYYLVGIPLGLALAFDLHYGVYALAWGIIAGAAGCAFVYGFSLSRLDYEKEVLRIVLEDTEPLR